jgi:hypothetical protein
MLQNIMIDDSAYLNQPAFNLNYFEALRVKARSKKVNKGEITDAMFAKIAQMRRKDRNRKDMPKIIPDMAELRNIIDQPFAFLCSPNSSLARGSSVMGSDIDAGTIITETHIPLDKQLKVIQSLKSTGFTVFHSSELHIDDNTNIDAYAEMQTRVIDFKPLEEFDREIEEYEGYPVFADSFGKYEVYPLSAGFHIIGIQS